MKCPKCQAENAPTSKFCAECATPLLSPMMARPEVTETIQTDVCELTMGSTFVGRYQIIEELGRGGMGRVYRAIDRKLNEEVALKLLNPEIASDKKTVERFSNELKIARKIVHKNVGRMFDLNEENGAPYITMEYIPGQDLRGLIKQTGQLTPAKAVAVAKQVAEGLVEAHRLGIVHRDLKPSNIIIDKDGNARIMDFGIARTLAGKGITGEGVIIGTPEYMSPEQIEAKDVDPRSDIYSLGVILYEMVTGRVPFEGDTPLSVAVKQKAETPRDPRVVNAQVPEDLSHSIIKCLEKDRAKRYQSAAEVVSELTIVEKGTPTPEKAIPRKEPFSSREITVKFRPKKVVVPALIVALTALVALSFLLLSPKKQTSTAAAAKRSIAVLPFEDLSSAKNSEYLCDGISETLINALIKIEGLWVPARTSAFFFKGKTEDIREIGRALGVEEVLEGSVQVDGDHLRVTARISHVQDGRQVWSEIYNRTMDDVFAIQDDIAKAIVGALKIQLLGDKSIPLLKNYTENPEAYRFYLQGRNSWNKRTEEGLTNSVGYFEKAIAIDPQYALAFTGLGDAYQVLGNNGFWPAGNAFPKAKEAALKALAIDDKLAEAHASLAAILEYQDWDFIRAEKEFKLAIELSPGYATAHQWYGMLFSILGRHEEALREIRTARNLDPLSPRINENVGWALYNAGQYGQAIEELNKALDLIPNHAEIYKTLGWAYEAIGKYDEAIQSYRRAIELSPEFKGMEAELASCYALMGRREEARKILADLIEYSSGLYFSPVSIAHIHAALGEKDQAFVRLAQAYDERDPALVMILNPLRRFDSLRADPRFGALLKKIGLPR